MPLGHNTFAEFPFATVELPRINYRRRSMPEIAITAATLDQPLKDAWTHIAGRRAKAPITS